MATVEGTYTGENMFTRGSYGKYLGFTTQMGLCVPLQCDVAAVQKTIEPLIVRYARNAHWEDPVVTFQTSQLYVADTSRAFTPGKVAAIVVAGVLLLGVIAGSVVELTAIGDDPAYEKEVLDELSRFKSTAQYETVIMQRKLPWARWFIALSASRNINKLNIQPFPYRKALEHEELNKGIVGNMRVFNGIKAVCTLYIMLASSFLFTWYAYLANPEQIESHKKQWAFLIVYCAFYTAPLLFMVAGFLQTFEFMQQPAEEMFSAGGLLRFYVWRLVKFVPLLATVLLFAMFILPFAGSGPIWQTYETVMKPCDSYWWTVLAQVNNVYPTQSFDDKCMPWAWFIPALTQLSLILPPLTFLYTKLMPRQGATFGREVLTRAVFVSIVLLLLAMNAGLTYYYDLGALPVQITPLTPASADPNYLNAVSFDYYNKLFMQGYFHLSSYVIGFCLALSYRRHAYETEQQLKARRERSSLAAGRAATASRLYTRIAESGPLRYGLYAVGCLAMLGACLWVYPFMSDAQNQSRLHCALYAAFANLIFLAGFSAVLMSALIGKAALFRYVFGCGMFLALSNLSAAMSLVGPLICLWYYLSAGHTLDIGWYTTQYYYDSNTAFTFLISIALATLSEKPFHSLVTIHTDTAEAERDGNTHSILEYRRGGAKGSSIAPQSVEDDEAAARALGTALSSDQADPLLSLHTAQPAHAKKASEDSGDAHRMPTAFGFSDSAGAADRSTRMDTQALLRGTDQTRGRTSGGFGDDSGDISR